MNTTIKAIKQTLLCLLFLLLAAPLHAAENEPQQLFIQANNAYDSGDYQLAADLYNAILDQGIESWELYYNLGNAYYRLDETGLSILNYERALRLAPTKKTIKDNLALACSKTPDHIEELPRLFLVEWFYAIVHLATPRGWRIVTYLLFALLCASLCIFFVARNYSTRKWMFVTSCIVAVLLIFSIVNATFSARNVTNSRTAIVTVPMVVVKSSPDAKSVDKFVIHEGTKVYIDDRQDDWWQITLSDGKTGWMNNGAEII